MGETFLWFDDADPPPPKIFSRGWLTNKRTTVAMYLHTLPVQFLVSIVVVTDLSLSMAEIFWNAEGEKFEALGTTIIALLFVEIMLRIFVDGLAFFKRVVDVLEFIIVVGGLGLIIIGPNMPVGVMRAAKPIVKITRALRAGIKIWLRGGHLKKSASQAISDKVRELIVKAVADFTHIRPENMLINALNGTFMLAKARLAAEAFDGLHSPFQIRGGFVEIVRVEAPVLTLATSHARVRRRKYVRLGRPEKKKSSSSLGKLNKPEPCHANSKMVRVQVRNAIVVIGPGPPVDWSDEASISDRKNKLVDLVVDHMVPSNIPAFQGGVQKNLRKLARIVNRTVTEVIHRRALQGIEITVSNVVLQYEDDRRLQDSQNYMAGYKLGSLHITTEDNDNPPDQGIAPIIERLAVKMERVSVYCNVRPQAKGLYSQLLLKHKYQVSLQRLRYTDVLERVRLALAKQKTPKIFKDACPCSKRGETLPEVFQQFTYVILPMELSIHCSFPQLRDMCEYEHNDSLVLEVFKGPSRVILDNRQSHVMDALVNDLQYWLSQENVLQVRPGVRISKILERRPGMQPVSSWEKYTIIRQWWLHAFQRVQEQTRTRSRHIACLTALQVRSGRRLEYIELVAHRVRCKRARSGYIRLWLSRSYAHETVEDQKRLREFHLRMGLTEILRGQIEARMIAADRELAIKSESRQRRMARPTEVIVEMDDESDEEIDCKKRSAHSAIFVEAPEGQADQALAQKEEEDSPYSFRLECSIPLMEVALCLVEERGIMDNSRVSHPPRNHPNGTRHKALRGWCSGVQSSFHVEFALPKDHGENPLLGIVPGSAKLQCADVGAKYCNARSGVETSALRLEPFDGSDGQLLVMSLEVKRVDCLPPERCARTKPRGHPCWGSADPCRRKKNAKPPLIFSGAVHIGYVNAYVDTLRILQMKAKYGDKLSVIVHEKVMQWVTAEPHWRSGNLATINVAQTAENNLPQLDPRRAKVLWQKRDIRATVRQLELALLLTMPVQFDWSLEVHFRGCHGRILRPVLSQSQWMTGKGCERLVECVTNVPPLRPSILRQRHPPMLDIELLDVGELRSTDAADGDRRTFETVPPVTQMSARSMQLFTI